MTAVDTGRPTPAVGPADLRRRSRWLAALLLPIGPAAIAVLRFVLPYSTVDDSTTVAQNALAHPGRLSLVIWLGFIASLTLVPAVLWIGRLTRRRAPKTTAAALMLAVPGYMCLIWLSGGDLLLWVGADQGLDQDTLVGLFEAVHPTSGIAAGLFVLGHVLGTVLLGVAMWRSRAVPRWAALATIVSQPLHFVAAVIVVSPALDLAAWGLTAVGFAAAAVAIWQLPDDEWELPPRWDATMAP